MDKISIYILISGIALGSFLLTYIIRLFAIRHRVLDIPNERSSHIIPTPRGGGLAIGIVWYAFLILWHFLGKIEPGLFYALLSGLIIVSIGFIDDIKSLSPGIRFFAQIAASVLGLYFLGGLQYIDLGIVFIHLHWTFNILVLFAMLWMINLFNFLDGSDGYLGAEGVFVFIALFFFSGNILVLAFAACIVGFLFWNWPQAKIFCGDVGSTLIGYTIMIFAIYFQNIQHFSVLIPLMLTGLFSVDATVTLIRRFRNNEKLSVAHKKHAYQRLIQSGYMHSNVLYLGLLVNVLLFLISYAAFIHAKYILALFFVQIIVAYAYVKFSDYRKSFK